MFTRQKASFPFRCCWSRLTGAPQALCSHIQCNGQTVWRARRHRGLILRHTSMHVRIDSEGCQFGHTLLILLGKGESNRWQTLVGCGRE